MCISDSCCLWRPAVLASSCGPSADHTVQSRTPARAAGDPRPSQRHRPAEGAPLSVATAVTPVVDHRTPPLSRSPQPLYSTPVESLNQPGNQEAQREKSYDCVVEGVPSIRHVEALRSSHTKAWGSRPQRLAGTHGLRRARVADRNLVIVVLAANGSNDDLWVALEAGASACVSKDAGAEEIAAVASRAIVVPRIFPARVRADAVQPRLQTSSGRQLSPREYEVLLLLADGLTLPQIERWLFISESTAKIHVANLEKPGVDNRDHAVMTADRLSFIGDDRGNDIRPPKPSTLPPRPIRPRANACHVARPN
jgi:DNA-binding NarL/FixJ family response regulator